MAWLPANADTDPRGIGNAIAGRETCWKSVFSQPLMAQLLVEILQRPTDLVMLELRRHKRCVGGQFVQCVLIVCQSCVC